MIDVQLTCEIRWNKMVIQIDWISKHLYSYTEDNLIKLINQTCLISKQEKMHFEKKKNERWIFYKFFESEKRNSAQKFTGSFFLKHETQVDWASKIIVLTIPIRQLSFFPCAWIQNIVWKLSTWSNTSSIRLRRRATGLNDTETRTKLLAYRARAQ